MSTIREMRINLGWTLNKAAQEAGLSRSSVKLAEEGAVVQANTAKAIADAFSRAYGKEIKVTDIDGLKVS